MGVPDNVERKPLEPTSERVGGHEGPKNDALFAAPTSVFPSWSKDGDVLKFAVSLASSSLIVSPVFAVNNRPAAALALFAGPWLYAYYEYRSRVAKDAFPLPADEARQTALLKDPMCAHCLTIPLRHLRRELAPPATDDGGQPTLEGPYLDGLLDHVMPQLQKKPFTERDGAEPRSAVLMAVVNDFGAERVLRVPSTLWSSDTSANGADEERLWLGMAAKQPTRQFDEPAVQLCAAMPGGNMGSVWASGVVMPILARLGADELLE